MITGNLMKSKKDIEDKIISLEAKLATTREMYKNLSQIDMLGSRKVINKTNGEIKALRWVIKNK